MIFWLAEVANTTNLSEVEGQLTTEEAEIHARLRGALRREEWLLGRWLGKQLVQRYLEATDRDAPNRNAIAILSDERGAPQAAVEGASLAVTLSISHSRGAALVALVDEPGLRIGADIEFIAGREESFLRDLLSPNERAYVMSRPEEEQALAATAIWCAREAYYKALRTGMPLGRELVEVTPQSLPGAGWAAFMLAGAEGTTWEGSWRVWGAYVMAVVTG